MKPDIPDRTFKIVGYDENGTPHLRPCHDAMTNCEDDEYVTLRSYIVGDDGLTSIERERDELRATVDQATEIVERIEQKIDGFLETCDLLERAKSRVDATAGKN